MDVVIIPCFYVSIFSRFTLNFVAATYPTYDKVLYLVDSSCHLNFAVYSVPFS